MLNGWIAWLVAAAMAFLFAAAVRPLPRTLLAVVALAHVAFVVSVAIFPIPVDADLTRLARERGWTGNAATFVNLTPFETIRQSLLSGIGSHEFTQAVQNVFVLSPVAVYAPLLWRSARSWAAFVPVAIIAGCSIEIGQLAVSIVLGFPYRSIDIDDAILNSLGIVIVFVLYRAGTALMEATRQQRASPTAASSE